MPSDLADKITPINFSKIIYLSCSKLAIRIPERSSSLPLSRYVRIQNDFNLVKLPVVIVSGERKNRSNYISTIPAAFTACRYYHW